MSTELATTEPKKAIVLAGERGLQFSDMESMYRFCVAVAASKEFGNITPEQAMMRIQAGAELGLSPVWSLANIFYYQGKPTVWGDALLGLVLANPLCEDVIETTSGDYPNDNYKAICEVKRKGRASVVREFSVADAKRAGIFERNVHKTHPKRMLAMRARAFALRDSFADSLRGLGMREELADIPEAKARTIEPSADLHFADEAPKCHQGEAVVRKDEGEVLSRISPDAEAGEESASPAVERELFR